jgi:hypothetical protein
MHTDNRILETGSQRPISLYAFETRRECRDFPNHDWRGHRDGMDYRPIQRASLAIVIRGCKPRRKCGR